MKKSRFSDQQIAFALLWLLKTPKRAKILEISAYPAYPCRHDHNFFRPRFPALVPRSQPRLTGA